jgi:hypothetical protein
MMLVSTLIEKLEKLKRDKGDLPVYFKDDWTIYPIQGVWAETVGEDQAESSDLEVGQPVVCIA